MDIARVMDDITATGETFRAVDTDGEEYAVTAQDVADVMESCGISRAEAVHRLSNDVEDWLSR